MDSLRRGFHRRAGQTTGEFALIVGGIAVLCIVGVLVFGSGISDLFGSNANRIGRAGPFVPPTSDPGALPESVDDCVGEGWRDYERFIDESDCLDYVASLTP